jgi:hypothetical protein
VREIPMTDSASPRWFRLFLVAMAGMLLVPHFFAHHWAAPPLRLGLPRVFSGDEPHYLVMLNSLLRDGDLDLANNYQSAAAGGDDAGLVHSRLPTLDHHVGWYVGDRFVRWRDIYQFVPSDADAGQAQLVVTDPALQRQITAKEYPAHWPGLPMLLAAVLFPLRHSTLLEPAALGVSWLVTVLAMLAFVSLAQTLGRNHRAIALATALTFLGTPVLHYGRTLFTEPYSLACILGAYALFIGKRQMLWAGVLLSLAVMLKLTNLALALPLAGMLLWRRDFKSTLAFAVPFVPTALVMMIMNHLMFGSITRAPQTYAFAPELSNFVGILVDVEHGLLPYAPIVLASLWGWPSLFRQRRWEALLPLLGFFALFCTSVPYAMWHGGYCFGPRYLLPVLPFLMLGLVHRFLQGPLGPWRIAVVTLLAVPSIFINLKGSIPYWACWGVHPLSSLF